MTSRLHEVSNDQAHELFVPQAGGIDEHHCLTDAEAAEERAHYQSAMTRYNRSQRNRWVMVWVLAVALVAAIAAYEFLELDDVILFINACLILALVAGVAAVMLPAYKPLNPGLEALQTHELTQLADLVDKHPAIAASVRRWLGDKKTLRSRDMWACRAYALRMSDGPERDAVIRRLRGDTSTNTAH